MKNRRSNQYNSQYFKDHDALDERIAVGLLHFIKNNNLKKILDVGCGTGQLVKYLARHNYQVQGCDSSNEAVKKARQINKYANITKTDATDLPFKNQSFDLISNVSVIEHLTRDQGKKFLKEAYRVLKPGGFIFMVTPNFNAPSRLLKGPRWFAYQDPTHITFYSSQTLAKLLKTSGFTNINNYFKVKGIINFILYSSPLKAIRDSFWISSQKT